MKSLRMYQDVKDEYKETDGQPEVKQKRKLYECANKRKKTP